MKTATATLAPAEIAAPTRQLLAKQTNATVALAEVSGVNRERRQVLVNYLDRRDAPFDYDYLILATGEKPERRHIDPRPHPAGV